LTYHFEDFTVGRVFELGSKLMTSAEIIEFASEFDPQPMHLSEEAGKASILGGLAASGWHTCSVLMRMAADAFIIDSTSQGSPGVDYIDWKKPVLAGDTLTGRSTVLEARLLRSRPGYGIVKFENEIRNQRGEIVCLGALSIIFSARDGSGVAL
jgi:acyl dehydratase